MQKDLNDRAAESARIAAVERAKALAQAAKLVELRRVVAEQNAKSPEFKKAWDSYSTFRKDYSIWKDHGYLK